MYEKAKELKGKPDDLMDTACLAVTGALHAHGLTESIPENPEKDIKGLEMKMTVGSTNSTENRKEKKENK